MHREDDGLDWLMYTSSRRQGGGALFVSYQSKRAIRVFRSSDLDGPFAPSLRDNYRTNYRYFYEVLRIAIGILSFLSQLRLLLHSKVRWSLQNYKNMGCEGTHDR